MAIEGIVDVRAGDGRLFALQHAHKVLHQPQVSAAVGACHAAFVSADGKVHHFLAPAALAGRVDGAHRKHRIVEHAFDLALCTDDVQVALRLAWLLRRPRN